jgi:DNA primase
LVGIERVIARENIPIYRYAEVRKAIANNELIFIVEGESCADALWDLGLTDL